MSQHWKPCQQNKPFFYIFSLAQFIANSALLLLTSLPSFPPLPSPSPLPCCTVCVEKNQALILAKSDINSFLSSDVQQNLPLINICSVSEPQGYWLHFVFTAACFLTLCCSLCTDIPLRVFNLELEWGREQDIPPRLTAFSCQPLPSGTGVRLPFY